MSAEHRKPAVAFVVLAIVAAAVVGVQRAEAQGGRLLAAVVGAAASVEGTLPQAELPVASVLDDAGLLSGGSFLVLPDAPATAHEAGAVAASGPLGGSTPARDPLGEFGADSPGTTEPGRSARVRHDVKREVAAVRKVRPNRRTPARVVPAAAASSRGPSTVTTSSSPAPRTSSTTRTVAPPRRPLVAEVDRLVLSRPQHVRAQHGQAHRGTQHGKAHRGDRRRVRPYAHRAVHRTTHHAAVRKLFRR